MKTLICPTYRCSLVRLAISKEKSVVHRYRGEEYRFCFRGCADVFIADPEKRLRETNDLIVCPTCIAEKPTAWAVPLNIAGREMHSCRCSYCVEVFNKDPDFYVERLEGAVGNEGVLDHEGCCVRPT